MPFISSVISSTVGEEVPLLVELQYLLESEWNCLGILPTVDMDHSFAVDQYVKFSTEKMEVAELLKCENLSHFFYVNERTHFY